MAWPFGWNPSGHRIAKTPVRKPIASSATDSRPSFASVTVPSPVRVSSVPRTAFAPARSKRTRPNASM